MPKKEKKLTSTKQMSDYQYARWAALYQAINMIAEMAEDKNRDFDELHLDQIAISKYVDEYSDDILHDLMQQQEREQKSKNEVNSWL